MASVPAGAAEEAARPSVPAPRPARSVEGWVLFVAGVHEEAADDDIVDTFGDHGEVRAVHVNLDRQTGAAKVRTDAREAAGRARPACRARSLSRCDASLSRTQGYALVEFAEKKEAESAIAALDGSELLGSAISVSWAFVEPAKRDA